MPVCYHCGVKKSGFTQFPSKYVGQKICVTCCDQLGLNRLLTTKESLNAHKKNHYQSFEQVVQLVNQRRPAYDQMAAAFRPNRQIRCSNGDAIEIDDQSQLVGLEKNRILFPFADFIRIENVDNSKTFQPGQVRMFHFFVYYRIFGQENVFITPNHDKEVWTFFTSLQPPPDAEPPTPTG